MTRGSILCSAVDAAQEARASFFLPLIGKQAHLQTMLTLPECVGLVETSTNLASVRCEAAAPGSDAECGIVCCTRSSLSSALEAVRDRIEKVSIRKLQASLEQAFLCYMHMRITSLLCMLADRR